MTPNQLPPLPPAAHRGPNGTGAYFDSYTADQMHAYALAALAQQAQEPVAWLYVDTVGERYLCFSRPTGGGAITNLYTTPPAPQPAPVDERAEFEVWARPNGYDMRRNDVLGHYRSIDTLRAWTGWQARAALQSTAPQTKGQS